MALKEGQRHAWMPSVSSARSYDDWNCSQCLKASCYGGGAERGSDLYDFAVGLPVCIFPVWETGCWSRLGCSKAILMLVSSAWPGQDSLPMCRRTTVLCFLNRIRVQLVLTSQVLDREETRAQAGRWALNRHTRVKRKRAILDFCRCSNWWAPTAHIPWSRQPRLALSHQL